MFSVTEDDIVPHIGFNMCAPVGSTVEILPFFINSSDFFLTMTVLQYKLNNQLVVLQEVFW